MQQPQPKAAPSADEWKRKFLTESKVNEELGRRLRDMKHRLEEEHTAIEKLRALVESTKTLNQGEEGDRKVAASCSRCATLELEVAKLRSLLVQNNIKHPDEVAATGIVEATPSDPANPLRRSHSILVRQQSGRVQCLRDMLDDLTPRDLVCVVASRRNSGVHPSIPSIVKPLPSDPPPITSTMQATPMAIPILPIPLAVKTSMGDNQVREARAADPLAGIEDKSLGDLFKYTIVLTGPVPPPPKKSALSAFLKAADFRRAKSLPDSPSNEGAKPPLPASLPSRTASGKLSEAATTTKPSQTLQGFVSGDSVRAKAPEAAPGSPMKRSGWLSSIVPPRFRAPGVDAPPSPLSKESSSRPTSNDSSGKSHNQSQQKPKMLTVFPPPPKGCVAELEGLLELCFPYGEKLPPLSDFSVSNLKRTLQERHRTYRSPDSTFVLTISSAANPTEITYAVCVHFPLFPEDDTGFGTDNADTDGEKLPTHGCISLLSPYPFFSLFFKVVFGIASIWESRRKEFVQDCAIALKEKRSMPQALTVQDFVDHFGGVMKRMKEMRVPAMGGWTRLVLAPQYTPLAFHRPHSENVKAERRMLVLEYAAPMLFAQLSVDQVLFLLGCLCCERKVLVVSDHANIVSSCVLALITLLEPLQWAGPVITLLPPRLDELLEAPVPLIAGRVSINSGAIPNFSTLTKPMNGVIEMNMDQNNLCMHEEDLMSYHELKLPGCDALVHELQQLSSRLFEHHLEPDFPSIEQMQACEVICLRIHRHMRSLCSLATGDSTALDFGNSPLCSPRKRQVGTLAPGAPDLSAQPRISETVQEYLRRFQDTQMFSMFKLQRQEEEAEENAIVDDDDEDENEGDDPDDPDDPAIPSPSRANKRASTKREGNRNDIGDGSDDDGEGDAAECGESEELFTDHAVSYRVIA